LPVTASLAVEPVVPNLLVVLDLRLLRRRSIHCPDGKGSQSAQLRCWQVARGDRL